MPDATWIPATPDAIKAVMRIADAVHPAWPESEAVLRERLALFPEGCLLCRKEGAIAGYLLSHPWTRGRPVPLDTKLGRLPARPDCLYLHDLALLETARGTGAGRAAVAMAEAIARKAGLDTVALVSLPGAGTFWRRMGFAPRPSKGLAGYGEGAGYMERPLTPAARPRDAETA